MSGRDKIYTCLLRRLHCNKHPHSRLRNIARSDDKSRYLTKKWSRDWRNREVFPYTCWDIWMAFLWHLIFADWISTLILWQTLCWKLDDGFASVMRSRHLTSNSGYATAQTVCTHHPRIYNLSKAHLGNSSIVVKHPPGGCNWLTCWCSIWKSFGRYPNDLTHRSYRWGYCCCVRNNCNCRCRSCKNTTNYLGTQLKLVLKYPIPLRHIHSSPSKLWFVKYHTND